MKRFIKSIVVLCFLVLGINNTICSQNSPTTHTVLIKKMKFIPEVLNVKKGDTVVWINKDFSTRRIKIRRQCLAFITT